MTAAALQRWIEELAGTAAREVAGSLRSTWLAHQQVPTHLTWCHGNRHWSLDLTQPRLMGIVNVTPDSFSDGGCYFSAAAAIDHGMALAQQGADLLDVGGESTRPGSHPVTLEEELRRVIPVVRELAAALTVPVCVDTSKSAVMVAALEVGAAMINDVTALSGDPDSAALLAQCEVPVILMHKQGTPVTMQHNPQYHHVSAEVYDFFVRRLQFCDQHGILRRRLMVDPGIGFGKNLGHNLALLQQLALFRGLGVPVALGVSRKRLIGALTGEEKACSRDGASHVLGAFGLLAGVSVLRVHDVLGAHQARAVAGGMMHRGVWVES
ncbi:MAG: dihydropteroate synthase [Magnetococcales bacterium]|nr:dihydropteroate synthase [Magnetococcales bacterium]